MIEPVHGSSDVCTTRLRLLQAPRRPAQPPGVHGGVRCGGPVPWTRRRRRLVPQGTWRAGWKVGPTPSADASPRPAGLPKGRAGWPRHRLLAATRVLAGSGHAPARRRYAETRTVTGTDVVRQRGNGKLFTGGCPRGLGLPTGCASLSGDAAAGANGAGRSPASSGCRERATFPGRQVSFAGQCTRPLVAVRLTPLF
jgi:hypothetical protein